MQTKGRAISAIASWRDVVGIDLRTLALFRINLGILIIVDLALRSRDFRMHYTDYGILPRVDLLDIFGPTVTSLHLITGSTFGQALLFLLAAMVALALIVGYRTRIVTVLSWLLLFSLQVRNGHILQGGDQLLLLLLFWGMFLPLGARFSVDRALERDPTPVPNQFASVATLALLIQVMCVYFFTALLKSDAAYIPDGTAVYYALQLDHYSTPIGRWLVNFPLLTQALTYYVWYLEFFGPILIFLPFFLVQVRLALLAMLIAMHLGFFLCLEIGLFWAISITSLLTFLPGAVWDWLGKRLERGGSLPISIYYDRDCDFCRKLCHLFKVFLILPGAIIRPAQDTPSAHALMEAKNSWVVVDSTGTSRTRFEAVWWLVARSPLFWPLSRLLQRLGDRGDRFYQWVADSRGQFSRITAVWLPYRDQQVAPTWYASAVATLFLALILHTNLEEVDVEIPIPESAESVKSTLRLFQKWSMFAPAPKQDVWLVPVGTLKNGMRTDVRGDQIADPDLGRPDPDLYPTYRQRKYESRIVSKRDAAFPPLYARYLCQRWNSRNHEEFQIESLQILLLEEPTLPDFQPAEVEVFTLWEGPCVPETEEEEPVEQVNPNAA